MIICNSSFHQKEQILEIWSKKRISWEQSQQHATHQVPNEEWVTLLFYPKAILWFLFDCLNHNKKKQNMLDLLHVDTRCRGVVRIVT